MLRPIGNDLLLACLAPDIRTTFHGAIQVLRLIERLSVKVTRLAAPAAGQEDEKLCHLHLGPYFVLLLRGTNFKYQVLRDLPSRFRVIVAWPCRTRWTQDGEAARLYL